VQFAIHAQLDYHFAQACDVLLQIEAGVLADQVVDEAAITITPGEHFARVPAQDNIGNRIWLRIGGPMVVDYRARVTVNRIAADLADLPKVPPHRLPGEAVPYLMPSRYCPSNRFADLVATEFAEVEGGAKIIAMRDWIAAHLVYEPGASNSETTALDTFVDRKGICRDYAHLMIALARAADIPARIASVYAPRVTPPDFHAVAEVFLGGAWHLVDATGMAEAPEMAIIGIGRDVGDVAFLTAFGALEMNSQSVSVTAV
jgi:transglutaminase-like putative cysteine protease